MQMVDFVTLLYILQAPSFWRVRFIFIIIKQILNKSNTGRNWKQVTSLCRSASVSYVRKQMCRVPRPPRGHQRFHRCLQRQQVTSWGQRCPTSTSTTPDGQRAHATPARRHCQASDWNISGLMTVAFYSFNFFFKSIQNNSLFSRSCYKKNTYIAVG